MTHLVDLSLQFSNRRPISLRSESFRLQCLFQFLYSFLQAFLKHQKEDTVFSKNSKEQTS